MRDAPTPKRRNATLTAVWITLFCVLVLELLGYAWVRMQCVGVGYEISALTNEQQKLNELQANLKVELARLKSPQRITKIAVEKLGLTMPTPKQMMVMP
jgi:cell division protein FtsL